VHKEVVFFLAKSDSQKVILSNEHTGYSWCDFGNSLAKLTYKSAKEVLMQAQNFLKSTYLK
jgi:bis(5'-nucleosidyl)-tetraphosphatase